MFTRRSTRRKSSSKFSLLSHMLRGREKRDRRRQSTGAFGVAEIGKAAELLENRTLLSATGGAAELEAPSLTGPIGSVAAGDVAITWDATAGATEYELLAYNVEAGQEIADASNLMGTSHSLNLAAGTVKVYLRASDGVGTISEWGTPLVFEVTGATPESPTLTGPTGSMAAGDVAITWDAAERATEYELLAEKRIEAVRAQLAVLVPKWKGTLSTKVTGLAVTEASLKNHWYDITPLMAFTKLKKLTIAGRDVQLDLSPVSSLPLESLTCPVLLAKWNGPVLKGIKTLKTINGQPVATFWKMKSAGWKPTPKQLAFFASVAKLEPQQQVDAVRKKLQEVNPGFDSKVQHKIEDGQVAELRFSSDQVTDISPVRALPHLKRLYCNGSPYAEVRLVDLSPLQGMKLTVLECSGTLVADLSPLQGANLNILSCDRTRIMDLSPLKGIKTLVTINGRPAAEFWKKDK